MRRRQPPSRAGGANFWRRTCIPSLEPARVIAQLSSGSCMWRRENFGDDLQACEATSIRVCGAGLSAAVPWVPNAELLTRRSSSKSRSRAFNNYKPGASHQTGVDKQMTNPGFNDTVAEIILSGDIDALEKYGRVLD
jgi:hypothetical protein